MSWNVNNSFGFETRREDGCELVVKVLCKICSKCCEKIYTRLPLRGKAKRYGSKFVSGIDFMTKYTVTRHLGSLVFGKTSVGFLFLIIRANHPIWTETERHGIVQTALDSFMKNRRKMKLSVGLETLCFNHGSLVPSSKTSRLDLDPNPSDSEAVTTGDSDVETLDPFCDIDTD